MGIFYIDDDDCERKFPTEMIVCPSCKGTGSHVNPSIDGNGITQSEMYELGDDFMDNYLGGTYDIECIECNGRNVVEVVVEELLDFNQLKEYQSQLEYDAICMAERAAGC